MGTFTLDQIIYFYGPRARAGDVRAIWLMRRVQHLRDHYAWQA